MKKQTATDQKTFYLCRVELKYEVCVLSTTPEKAKRIALREAKKVLDHYGDTNRETGKAWTKAQIEEWFGANVYALPLDKVSPDNF